MMTKIHISKIIWTTIILFFTFLNVLEANQKEQLNIKQNELERIKKEIEQTKRKISTLTSKEKKEIKLINQYKRNLAQLNNKLQILKTSISKMQDSIRNLSLVLSDEEKKLNKLKLDYTNLVGSFYLTQFKDNNLKYDVSNEPSKLDIFYLKWIQQRVLNTISEINKYIDSTKKIVDKLDQITRQQENIKKAHEVEKLKIDRLAQRKSAELSKIKSDKDKLLKELRAKEQSAKKLRAIIAELIKKQSTENTKQTPKQSNVKSAGTLNWPTNSRKILRGYGQSVDPITNLSFDNPGIDIATPSGSAVYAAGAGVVKKVYWLPGYGTLIIIDHGNNLRTVYANLLRITVKEGDSVTAGKVIGYSGESLDGQCLHFQVWIGSQKVNPLSYLR